ncbi:hypothetical protein GCM10010377_82140 [Streptomyces viridiviolaceus]|nr:hypothetical protein GCM10010377_82140 [Streptomyces viridiviolaceus]
MVVDGGVDVVEAHAAAPGPADLAAEDFVASAVGNPAEFLHVDVDELAGPPAFVAADDLSGGPVQVGQPVQAVAGQDPVGGRGGQAQDRAEAGGAEFAGLAQSADAGLHGRRSAVRGRLERSARPGAPSDRQRRIHLWAVAREMPIRRPHERQGGLRRHVRPADACHERSAGHYGGTRRPPCGAVLDSSTTPEVFAMIKPGRRQQRS